MTKETETVMPKTDKPKEPHPLNAQARLLADAEAKAKKEPKNKEAQAEMHRIRGKASARKTLLATTRRVCMCHDAPTSKGKQCMGAMPRLPNKEADALVKARAAKEIGG